MGGPYGLQKSNRRRTSQWLSERMQKHHDDALSHFHRLFVSADSFLDESQFSDLRCIRYRVLHGTAIPSEHESAAIFHSTAGAAGRLRCCEVRRNHEAGSGKEQTGRSLVHLCYIQGLYTSGRFQEASEELEKVYSKRADIGIHLLYQHLAFDCRVKQGDIHAAHQARQDTYQLMGNVKPKQRPMIENTLHVMDSCLALAEARYEDFYALEERVQAEAANQLQLVSSAFRMGKADLATGNLDGAKEHFEDVIAEGNTLYMANGARQLLADMVPAELPASAED